MRSTQSPELSSLVAPVERMVQESGVPDGFGASAWLRHWLIQGGLEDRYRELRTHIRKIPVFQSDSRRTIDWPLSMFRCLAVEVRNAP